MHGYMEHGRLTQPHKASIVWLYVPGAIRVVVKSNIHLNSDIILTINRGQPYYVYCSSRLVSFSIYSTFLCRSLNVYIFSSFRQNRERDTAP